MLICFTVGNFRSIRDPQQFTFSTSSDRMHAATHCMRTGLKAVPRLSRAAVVFGPNGSGKTNLLSAVAVMRDLVLHSTTLSSGEFAQRYSPFLLANPERRPTEFEVDVVLDGVRYQYAFAYDDRRICAERLLVFPTGKSQRWFERTVLNEFGLECWAPFSASFTGPRTLWRDATRAPSLFLTTAVQLNARQLEPLFDWFENGLALLFGSRKVDFSSVADCVLDGTRKPHLIRFLQGAGIHVHDARVVERHTAPPGRPEIYPDRTRPPDKLHGNPVDPAAVEFSHRREDGSVVWMPSTEESTGTQRLAGLFGPLLNALRLGQVLLVDEFDLSLHPLVARYLIELINDPEISLHGAQLLLTSHNTTLMDLDILRRDEIWLMQLDDTDASSLVRLWQSSSPPRKHELIGKRYLYGRYGAVPEIRTPELVSNAAETPRPQTPSGKRDFA
jgi:hypothetical protein